MAERIRKQICTTLDPEVLRELETWCSEQRPVVTKAAAIEQAIREFMRKSQAEKLYMLRLMQQGAARRRRA